MSKRKLILLGAMIIALIIVFGVYFIISTAPGDDNVDETTTSETIVDSSSTETEDETTVEEHDPDIFDFTSIDIQLIVLKQKEEQTLVIERKTGIRTDEEGNEKEYEYFELIEPTGYIVDESALNSFSAAISWIYESKYIGVVEDLEQFGLKEPQANLTVELKNGEKHSMDIGDPTLANDGFYVSITGTNDVRSIYNSKANSIMITLKSIVSKEVFSMVSDDVVEFSIKREDEDKIVAVKKTEDELSDIRYKFERIKIIEPLIFDANTSNIISNIDLLLTSTVNEYIELETIDFAQYGLATPAYKVQLTDKDSKTVSLEIGNTTKEADARYCRFEGMNAVFTLRNDVLGLLDMPLKEMVSSFIYIVNIVDVDGIEVIAEGYDLDCVIEHIIGEDDKEEEVFYVNEMDANAVNEKDKSYFKAFYQALISISRDSFDLLAEPVLDPEITITYKFDGLEDMKIEYVKKDDLLYYAFINGEYTGILVRNIEFTGEGKLYTTIPILLDKLK